MHPLHVSFSILLVPVLVLFPLLLDSSMRLPLPADGYFSGPFLPLFIR